ncbi:MAG: HTTM domain-containing protein [Bdellovibrionales bacterium]|nr:HTTM domain-containing protein [Bdellovibrionales bacterium]
MSFSFKNFGTAFARGWNRFFFEPTSPATIGMFRIALGIVVFISMLGKLPFRELFYGATGIVSEATMNRYFPDSFLYFRWVPTSDPALFWYFVGILIACFTLTIGLFSRLSSVLVFLGIISLSNRNFFVDNSGDDIMRINAFFLMFARSGAAYSVDRWLRRRRGKEGAELVKHPPWAQRMLQLQLAYLYLNTAYLKLPGEGWSDGTAIYYALNYIELRRFQLKPLFYYLWQIKLMTYLVMVAEFGAGTLIWFRVFRYPVLIAAFLLHFGINLTMQFPVFQYVMMASLINFVYPEDMERWITRLKRGIFLAPNTHPV